MPEPIPCGDIATKEECIANPNCKYVEYPTAGGYCREKTMLEKYSFWLGILGVVIVISLVLLKARE